MGQIFEERIIFRLVKAQSDYIPSYTITKSSACELKGCIMCV
jgi:hypothetical protein